MLIAHNAWTVARTLWVPTDNFTMSRLVKRQFDLWPYVPQIGQIADAVSHMLGLLCKSSDWRVKDEKYLFHKITFTAIHLWLFAYYHVDVDVWIFLADEALFRQVPIPGPHDWFANHNENGQTFYQFATKDSVLPTRTRSTIYFLPLSFSSDSELPADILHLLLNFASSFFAMNISLLKPTDDLIKKVAQRKNIYTGKLQVNVSWPLKFIS